MITLTSNQRLNRSFHKSPLVCTLNNQILGSFTKATMANYFMMHLRSYKPPIYLGFICFFILTIPTLAYADAIWPAAAIIMGYQTFWYLIVATVIIEAGILMSFIKLTVVKALIISLVGNIVSGIIGTLALGIGMLGWHYLFDDILSGTFSLINVITTIGLTFVISVLLEIITIRLIWKLPIKKLLIPMTIGNLLSYAFILFNAQAYAP